MAAIVTAELTVSSCVTTNCSKSMPPKRNTAANSGRAPRISRSMKATEATSLPQMIPSAVTRLTSSTSKVCRSRSPLTAPAASAGANRLIRVSWKKVSELKTWAPIWAAPWWLGTAWPSCGHRCVRARTTWRAPRSPERS